MSSHRRFVPRGLRHGVGILLAVAGSACAATADGPLASEQHDPGETSTTAAAAPAPPHSEGTAKIGDDEYALDVTCIDLGAGEVTVRGAGRDLGSGDPVELYLKASLVDPYVGLRLADGTLIEPSLDSPLDLYLQNDVIRASAIRFVRDLDLETGEASEVGFGEFEIHCYSYERDSPS